VDNTSKQSKAKAKSSVSKKLETFIKEKKVSLAWSPLLQTEVILA
jgi:hypothetical protein